MLINCDGVVNLTELSSRTQTTPVEFNNYIRGYSLLGNI